MLTTFIGRYIVPKINIIVNLKRSNSTDVMMENGIIRQINLLKEKGMFTWHLNINS